VSCFSEDEAHFVCGCLNSTLARLAAGFFIIETQIAPQILENIALPRFDPKSELHSQIAVEAKRLFNGAVDAHEPIHERLDELCKDLWCISPAEMKAVAYSYRDLYQHPRGSESKEATSGEETE
jgi:hypothetical protein